MKKLIKIADTNHSKVYSAILPKYKEPVIIKQFKPAAYHGLTERLVREVNFLVNIKHPNVVQLLEISDGPLPTLILENAGVDLWKYSSSLSRDQRIELFEPIFTQILNGLYCLHINDIIHRDLKSSNILIKASNDLSKISNDKNLLKNSISNTRDYVKICDFGFARTVGLDMSPTSTLNYSAPEVAQGDYTEKADMWAVGCIIYEWIEQKILYKGTIKLMHTQAKTVKAKIPSILLNKLLIEEPDDRASADECLDLLGAEIIEVQPSQKIMVRKSMRVDLNIRHVVVANMLDMERYYDVTRQTLALAVDIFDKWLMIDGGNDDMVLHSIAAVVLASYKYKVVPPENFAARYTEEIIVEAVLVLFRIVGYNIEYLDLWSLMLQTIEVRTLPNTDEHMMQYWKRVCDLLLDYNEIFARTEQELVKLLDRVIY